MFGTLLKKDLLVELRTREITVSMLTFGLTVILTFAFAFNLSPDLFQQFAPGLFWIMVLFITVLGLHRGYSFEKEFDAFSLLISAPVERGLIFLSKWCSGTIFLLLTEAVIILPFFLFLQLALPARWAAGLGLMVLGDVGIMAVGSLVSGLAMRARMSEVLLPVLLFPLVSPMVIATVKTTQGIFADQPFDQWRLWLQIMVTFTLVFGLAGYLIFEHITEE